MSAVLATVGVAQASAIICVTIAGVSDWTLAIAGVMIDCSNSTFCYLCCTVAISTRYPNIPVPN